MNIGIIGCGLIGNKRAASIYGDNKLVAVCDVDLSKARQLGTKYKVAFITDDYKELIKLQNIELVIVSVINYELFPITLHAIQNGKNVIVEKPGGISSVQLNEIVERSNENHVFVKVGFNHRYHPAMLKAKEIIDSGQAGDIMFIRGRYGHGGRVGYDKEWRANATISGGGETIDQGVHLIDLARWFMGDFSEVIGFADTFFGDMDVDDNGFIGLRKKDGRAAWLQVSCTEWKNLFSFEIYCKQAKLAIEGLGGSYGTEKLFHYQMLPEMGPPDTLIYEFPRGDNSWRLELEDTISAIKNNTKAGMRGWRSCRCL